jgi:hypothetical protein
LAVEQGCGEAGLARSAAGDGSYGGRAVVVVGYVSFSDAASSVTITIAAGKVGQQGRFYVARRRPTIPCARPGGQGGLAAPPAPHCCEE